MDFPKPGAGTGPGSVLSKVLAPPSQPMAASATAPGPIVATIGATEILQEIRRSVAEFRAQLNQLNVKVSQLEETCAKSVTPTTISKPVAADIPSEQVIRLDGRIDLLEGKFNLIKHELKQLYLVNNQQQLSAVSTTWDQLEGNSYTGDVGLGPLGFCNVKIEPEITFSEVCDDNGADNLFDKELHSEGELTGEEEEDEEELSLAKKPRTRQSGLRQAGSTGSVTRGKSHECAACGIACPSKSRLIRHYNKHFGLRYRCSLCSTVFSRQDEWINHMKSSHANQGSSSDASPPAPISVLRLTKSQLASIEHNPATNKYPCPFTTCSKEFARKQDIIQHYQSHSLAGRQHLCRFCPARFLCNEKLTEHVRRSHPNDVGNLLHLNPRLWMAKGEKQCPVCSRVFSRREHAIRHLKTHSATLQEEFQCVDCNKSFARRDRLLAHRREKHATAATATSTASASTSTESKDTDSENLSQNSTEDGTTEADQDARPSASTPDPKPTSDACPVCSKTFSDKSKLKRHVIGCKGLKPFKCTECGAGFTQNAALIQHRRGVHQGVKRFLCSDCGSCFFGSSSYKKHMRIHSGVKPYSCTVCNRRFNGSSDLKRHEKIHTDVRDINCSQCDLKFHRRDALVKHMLVHTGEKPWMCDLCGSSFSQSGSMKKHRETCLEKVGTGKQLVYVRKPRTAVPPASGYSGSVSKSSNESGTPFSGTSTSTLQHYNQPLVHGSLPQIPNISLLHSTSGSGSGYSSSGVRAPLPFAGTSTNTLFDSSFHSGCS